MGSECGCGGSLAPRSACSRRGVGSRAWFGMCCGCGVCVGVRRRPSSSGISNRARKPVPVVGFQLSTTPHAHRHRVSTQQGLDVDGGTRPALGHAGVQLHPIFTSINAIAVCLCHVVLGLSHVKTSRPRQQHRSLALLLTEKVLRKFSRWLGLRGLSPSPSPLYTSKRVLLAAAAAQMSSSLLCSVQILFR